jgi:hypothetical protein
MKGGGVIARFRQRKKKLFAVTISTMEEVKIGFNEFHLAMKVLYWLF